MKTEIFHKYSPAIYFDEQEPFYPVRIGMTRFDRPGPSPSVRGRNIEFDMDMVSFALEYAIYFDYDIGHLYELEHFWVYVGKDGSVVRAEASFHGDYFFALLKDRSNLEEGTHVKLYSQPGKHAFTPMLEMLELIPDLYVATNEKAGDGGLLVPHFLAGILETNREIDELVYDYLQTKKFTPSMKFNRYSIEEHQYTEWTDLVNEIPLRIQSCLGEIRRKKP